MRVAAGVEQAMLADNFGVHRVTLARWEAGTSLRGRYLVAYVAALDEMRRAIEEADDAPR